MTHGARDNQRNSQRLIDAVLDGTATPDEIEALGEWITASPENADRFTRQSILHGHTRSLLLAGDRGQGAGDSEMTHSLSFRERAGVGASFTPASAFIGIAAALLMTAAAVAIYVFAFAGESVAPERLGPPIATLIDATGVVLVDDDVANPGAEYRSGDYAVESGSAQFQLTSGATVHLRRGSRLAMHGAMRSTLLHGSASFDCPESAHGYTVEMPDGARVIDLGTRFGVHLDDANDEVHVFTGRVRVERGDASRVLTAPAAVRIVDGRIETIEPRIWRFPDIAIERDTPIASLDFAEAGAGWRGVGEIDPLRDGAIVLDGGAEPGDHKQAIFVDLDTADGSPLGALEWVDADGRVGRSVGSVWLGWTMRGSGRTTDGWAGLSLFDGGDDRDHDERVFIGKVSGYDAYSYDVPGGVREDLDIDPKRSGVQLSFADAATRRLLARIELSDAADRISVWLDPDPTQPELGPPHGVIELPALRFDRLRLEAGGGSGVWTFDDLKIGPTRRSVTGQPDEIE